MDIEKVFIYAAILQPAKISTLEQLENSQSAVNVVYLVSPWRIQIYTFLKNYGSKRSHKRWWKACTKPWGSGYRLWDLLHSFQGMMQVMNAEAPALCPLSSPANSALSSAMLMFVELCVPQRWQGALENQELLYGLGH